ncbi:metal-dependent hydrolase [Halococcus sp. PRR34]|uniref:metal-dependent hydrolase n=1 Tax=Halococcus sp. PRR34 TaxID=3020830 RepID=UPI0023609388|nr:metal-dependent hydrolase [Halococcus sp. PRR34]
MSTASSIQRITEAIEPTNAPSTARVVACLGALLLYVPFGMSIAEMYPAFAVAGAVITIGVAGLPDRLTWRFIPHGVTHSLVGASVVGALVAVPTWWIGANITVYAGGAIVTPIAAAQYGFTVGSLAGFGHVLGDFLTGTDVRLVWPIADYEVSVNVPRLLNPRNNEGINLIGTLALLTIVVGLASSSVTAAMIP